MLDTGFHILGKVSKGKEHYAVFLIAFYGNKA